MIKIHSGREEIQPYTAPASTAFDFNDVVYLNSSGVLAKATGTTPRSQIVGLIQRTIASTDSDYASAKTVPVLVPSEETIFEATVDTGTLTTAMRGGDYDLNDEDGINVTANVQRAVKIVKYLSTSKALIKFVTGGDKVRLVTYEETVALADFTDNGDTTGTVELNVSIPAGAVYNQTFITAVTGFAGDTSATVQVGDGTDVDRYSTGTPSVFATAANGIDAGVPSGTKFHSAAKTPTVIVTSGSDFGAVTAGQMTIVLSWYEVD
jgi:hypothetical protein